MITSIILDNVTVDFPIYSANSRSLKNSLIRTATGGQLNSNDRGRITVRALENLSFSLKEGDRLGLIGHNGAGKSTLLRVLSGIYEPTGGSKIVKGNIGSLIDLSLGIDPEATGRENIYLRAGLLGFTRTQINQQIDELIDFSELGNFVDMPLHTYSTGMNLRLTFSISTLMRPDIILMDEWLSVGDENFKKKAEQRMNDLIKSIKVLVVASHSRDLIMNTCNRVLWLEHGKIRMDGDTHSVTQAYFGDATPVTTSNVTSINTRIYNQG